MYHSPQCWLCVKIWKSFGFQVIFVKCEIVRHLCHVKISNRLDRSPVATLWSTGRWFLKVGNLAHEQAFCLHKRCASCRIQVKFSPLRSFQFLADSVVVTFYFTESWHVFISASNPKKSFVFEYSWVWCSPLVPCENLKRTRSGSYVSLFLIEHLHLSGIWPGL